MRKRSDSLNNRQLTSKRDVDGKVKMACAISLAGRDKPMFVDDNLDLLCGGAANDQNQAVTA